MQPTTHNNSLARCFSLHIHVNQSVEYPSSDSCAIMNWLFTCACIAIYDFIINLCLLNSAKNSPFIFTCCNIFFSEANELYRPYSTLFFTYLRRGCSVNGLTLASSQTCWHARRTEYWRQSFENMQLATRWYHSINPFWQGDTPLINYLNFTQYSGWFASSKCRFRESLANTYLPITLICWLKRMKS